MELRDKIKGLLENELPLVDFESDCLYMELDSLGVTTILMILSSEFGIELEAKDATPKNLMSLDCLVRLVESKLSNK